MSRYASWGAVSRVSLLAVVGVAFLAAALLSAIFPSGSAGAAINHTGPYDTRTRYALEFSPTTNQTTLNIPIYFQQKPTGNVLIDLNDIKASIYQTGIKVSIGNVNTRTNALITVPASSFVYDAGSGWYKHTLVAKMTGQGSSLHMNKFIHFRLSLRDARGLIGYGGGSFQQVSRDYPSMTIAREYNLYMATPCTVKTNQTKAIRFIDLDHLGEDNGWKPITITIRDETDGVVIATLKGDNYPDMARQNATFTYNMQFKPLHKYSVKLSLISSNNVIRYDFPYDNIAYRVGCSWALNGATTASVDNVANQTTAKEGQVIRWNHTVGNSGPHYTDKNTYSSLNTAGSSIMPGGWSDGMNQVTRGKQANPGNTRTIGPSVANKTQYTATAADVGKKICQGVRFWPQSSSSGATGYSGVKCVDVVASGFIMDVDTSVSTANRPGDTATWTHKITNRSSSAEQTSGTLTYTGQNQGVLGTGVVGTWTRTAALAKGASEQKTSTRVITQNDVGTDLCRRTGVTPQSATNSTTNTAVRYSANACLTIPYNYTLTPTISVDASAVEPGSDINITSRITNSGPTKSNNTDWRLTYVTIPAGQARPGAASNASDPCTYYKQVAGSTCANASLLGSGAAAASSGTDVIQAGGLNFVGKRAEIADLSVGTQICYGLSVKNWAASGAGANEWRHAAVACAVVAKRPTTQVLGGDLFVGRSATGSSFVSTSTKVVSGKQYGSWSEYAIASAGPVSGMASASGYAGGVAVSNICGVSNLTLGNRSSSGSCVQNEVGQYILGGSAPAVASRFPVTSSTQALAGDQNISSLGAGRVYTASGDALSLHASQPIAKGDWYVINASSATVTVSGNITYTNDSLDGIKDIPQVVIIARNIIIADRATQVDAWLVATGTGNEGRVNTCGAGDEVGEATSLTSSLCTSPLRVNGPVIANKLLLRRTAGSGTGAESGDPAEVFNLRPDAYLWATSLLNSDTKVRTVLSTELPPRY